MDTNKLIALMPELAVFKIVVDEGSFTAAARKLGVTPSALSKQLSRLEQTLSTKLLERTTRKLVITQSGKGIYDQCCALLEATKQVVEFTSSEHETPSGSVTVAAPKAFLSIVLQPMVLPFLTQYPDIELKLKARDGDIDLISEGIDVVFRLTEKPTEGLVLKQLGKVSLSLCASQITLSNEVHLLTRRNCWTTTVSTWVKPQPTISGISSKMARCTLSPSKDAMRSIIPKCAYAVSWMA